MTVGQLRAYLDALEKMYTEKDIELMGPFETIEIYMDSPKGAARADAIETDLGILILPDMSNHG